MSVMPPESNTHFDSPRPGVAAEGVALTGGAGDGADVAGSRTIVVPLRKGLVSIRKLHLTERVLPPMSSLYDQSSCATILARQLRHLAGDRSGVHCARLYTLGSAASKSASPAAYRRVELYAA
ncbi:Os07g0538250 [Oryza sativa Japonica Group]|uniref:Os07g0538250 protein n=1 Tax=Oryza sativa subsp. japonica TaxID=39947 RepID=A0A0P0X708_ORYSJ|nr:hypothetical protein EE612_039783 [Oryza sativa]BAT01940.1 Os07g0538250 [Oryza sativa Japonica Group]